MKYLILMNRLSFNKNCIISKFMVIEKAQVKGAADKVVFTCSALENPEVGAERNKDLAIPNGEYKLKWHSSPKFNKAIQRDSGDNTMQAILLYNDKVPASRCILIHQGNTAADTEGCILLGEAAADLNSITDSRVTVGKFYKLIKNIMDEAGPDSIQFIIQGQKPCDECQERREQEMREQEMRERELRKLEKRQQKIN